MRPNSPPTAIIIFYTSMDSRKADYELIDKGLKSKNSEDRRQAYIARERINAESPDTRRMREKLVDAHRQQNRAEVEKLHRSLEAENRRVKERVEAYYRGRKGY